MIHTYYPFFCILDDCLLAKKSSDIFKILIVVTKIAVNNIIERRRSGGLPDEITGIRRIPLDSSQQYAIGSRPASCRT